MVYHPTAYCPKCERLQVMERATLHSGEPFRVDSNEDQWVGTTERAVHTTVMLRCRHHVTVVMSA